VKPYVVRAVTKSDQLLVRARNAIVFGLRQRAWDKPLTPTPLLLDIDAHLRIADHQDYVGVSDVMAGPYRTLDVRTSDASVDQGVTP
jgi:hypothetical protein